MLLTQAKKLHFVRKSGYVKIGNLKTLAIFCQHNFCLEIKKILKETKPSKMNCPVFLLLTFLVLDFNRAKQIFEPVTKLNVIQTVYTQNICMHYGL